MHLKNKIQPKKKYMNIVKRHSAKATRQQKEKNLRKM